MMNCDFATIISAHFKWAICVEKIFGTITMLQSYAGVHQSDTLLLHFFLGTTLTRKIKQVRI